MKIRSLIIVFLLIVGHSSSAQVSQDTIIYIVDDGYIAKYKNRITAKVFYINTFNSYVFGDRNSDLRLEMEPNKQNKLGVSLAYDFISLSYSFAPDFMAENKDNDDSKLFNLNLRTFLGQWMQTIDIYSQKGFYESNVYNVYLPNTKALKIGGSTSYIFNDRFSYRAVSNQVEKQLKSTGSFIAGITYYYSKFSLIAQAETAANDDLFLFDFAFTPSYQYNWVPVDNILVSAGGDLGLGLNYSKSQDDRQTSLLTQWGINSTATYDLENLYFGGQFSYQALNHNTDSSTYTQDNIPFLQLFVGYRFRAPKKLIRTTENIKNKLKVL